MAYQEGRTDKCRSVTENLLRLVSFLIVTRSNGGLVNLVIALSGKSLLLNFLHELWPFNLQKTHDLRETLIDYLYRELAYPTSEAISDKTLNLRDSPRLAMQLGLNERTEVVQNWSLGSSIECLDQNLAECRVRFKLQYKGVLSGRIGKRPLFYSLTQVFS